MKLTQLEIISALRVNQQIKHMIHHTVYAVRTKKTAKLLRNKYACVILIIIIPRYICAVFAANF